MTETLGATDKLVCPCSFDLLPGTDASKDTLKLRLGVAPAKARFEFGLLNIRACFGFRNSDFGFSLRTPKHRR